MWCAGCDGGAHLAVAVCCRAFSFLPLFLYLYLFLSYARPSRRLVRGEGTDADAKKGAELLSLAAGAGCLKAMFNLGVLHWNGTGVAESIEEAARLFEAAANLGYVEAQVTSPPGQHRCISWRADGAARVACALFFGGVSFRTELGGGDVCVTSWLQI